MQRIEVSGAVRPLYGSLGVKGLNCKLKYFKELFNHPIHQKATDEFQPETGQEGIQGK
jgi:hypothetical protein